MAPLFTLPSPSTWYNGQALNASSLSSRSIALSITPWDFSQLPGKFTNHGYLVSWFSWRFINSGVQPWSLIVSVSLQKKPRRWKSMLSFRTWPKMDVHPPGSLSSRIYRLLLLRWRCFSVNPMASSSTGCQPDHQSSSNVRVFFSELGGKCQFFHPLPRKIKFTTKIKVYYCCSKNLSNDWIWTMHGSHKSLPGFLTAEKSNFLEGFAIACKSIEQSSLSKDLVRSGPETSKMAPKSTPRAPRSHLKLKSQEFWKMTHDSKLQRLQNVQQTHLKSRSNHFWYADHFGELPQTMPYQLQSKTRKKTLQFGRFFSTQS